MHPCFPHSKDLSQMFVSARAMFDACWESSWCVLFSSVVAEISNLKRINNFYGGTKPGSQKGASLHMFLAKTHFWVCSTPSSNERSGFHVILVRGRTRHRMHSGMGAWFRLGPFSSSSYVRSGPRRSRPPRCIFPGLREARPS